MDLGTAPQGREAKDSGSKGWGTVGTGNSDRGPKSLKGSLTLIWERTEQRFEPRSFLKANCQREGRHRAQGTRRLPEQRWP